jgi:TolR protein
MGMSVRNRGDGDRFHAISDINVTPMVDVMLVLLIIFMVTAPILNAGVKINLPQGSANAPKLPQEPAVVTIAKDGQIFVGKDEVTRDKLANAVKAKLEGDLARPVHVRGDKDIPYGEIVSIMDLLSQNGIVKIALVSDSHSRAASSESASKPASAASPIAPTTGGAAPGPVATGPLAPQRNPGR